MTIDCNAGPVKAPQFSPCVLFVGTPYSSVAASERPAFAADAHIAVYLARGGERGLGDDGTGQFVNESRKQNDRDDLVSNYGKLARSGNHLRHAYCHAGLRQQRKTEVIANGPFGLDHCRAGERAEVFARCTGDNIYYARKADLGKYRKLEIRAGDNKKQHEERRRPLLANTDGLTGVSTGYYKLDDITSGWQASDLVIIAGRPAMGKTSFALSMAKNIAADLRVPMAFFSLEMSNVQLVNRLISNVCEIQGSKILNGQLQRDEWERLDKRINNLLGAPLYIDDTPGLSVFELRTKARRLVREHGVKLIMIDYLQLMNANGMRFSSRQEEVSTISRSLKGLAKELDIPILALSQLNRGVESREGLEGKRPQLSDLRESGAIEQDADMVIFVHRPEYYHIYQDDNGRDLHGMAQIIIAKHRKGATGDVLLTFRGEYTRFENPEDKSLGNRAPIGGGEIVGSKINGSNNTPPEMPEGYDPFAGGAPLPPQNNGPLPF